MTAEGRGVDGAITPTSGDPEKWVWPSCLGGGKLGDIGVVRDVGHWQCDGRCRETSRTAHAKHEKGVRFVDDVLLLVDRGLAPRGLHRITLGGELGRGDIDLDDRSPAPLAVSKPADLG